MENQGQSNNKGHLEDESVKQKMAWLTRVTLQYNSELGLLSEAHLVQGSAAKAEMRSERALSHQFCT